MHTEWMVWAMARHRYVLLSIPVLIASLVLAALAVHPSARAATPAAAGRPLPAHSQSASGVTSATASPGITCPPSVPAAWRVVPAANSGPAGDTLTGVTAISPTDVWAVGGTYSSMTLTEQFDGFRWTAVSSPTPGYGGALTAVSGDAANDVWAVGYYNDPSAGGNQALIEHWNGATWSVVSSPNPAGTEPDHLTGVVALSSTNAWAVGYDTTGSAWNTLIEHWDGSQWSVMSSLNPGSNGNYLYAITATSATDVWAVGMYANSSAEAPLVEHWDGTSWSVVSAPSPAGSVSVIELNAISATSATDIWAAGEYQASSSGGEDTLTEHWNGSAWSVVSSPTPGSGTDGISVNGVAATSASDAWVVGYDDTNMGATYPILEHWNGTSWSLESGPKLPSTLYSFNAITVVAGSQVMAVGDYEPSSSSSNFALSEYYAPMCLDPGGPPIAPGSTPAARGSPWHLGPHAS